MNNQCIPPAAALAIFTYGNQADNRKRLLFCNYLIRLADLDDYPRRAGFIAAFSSTGAESARRDEAHALADSCLLPADYVAYCAARSEEAFCNDHQLVMTINLK